MTLPDESPLRDLVTAFCRMMKYHQDGKDRRLDSIELELHDLKRRVDELERQALALQDPVSHDLYYHGTAQTKGTDNE
jgi:hypothetical protein